jgi:uncharacterized membrane protein (DUF373 family)
MTPDEHHSTQQGAGGEPHGYAVRLLELLDNWAHIVVAAFFILMASTVIIHMSVIFLRQIPLIVPAATMEAQAPGSQTTENAPKPVAPLASETSPNATKPSAPTPTPLTTPEAGSMAANTPASAKMPLSETAPGTSREKMEETHVQPPADPFVKNSLELLSNILFVVILLELLRTIITYLQTHDIQAIMQEFLVVGIISSVRKILLVGAEASLIGSKGMEFIQEASGVVIDILGILLLILGLVMLKRAFGSKVVKASQEG